MATSSELNPSFPLVGSGSQPWPVVSTPVFNPIPPDIALRVNDLAMRRVPSSLNDSSGKISYKREVGLHIIAALRSHQRDRFNELAQIPQALCKAHRLIVIQIAVRRQYWEGLLHFLKRNRPVSFSLQDLLLCEAAVVGKEAIVPALFLENESLDEPLLGKALRIAAIHGHGAFIDALLIRGETASENSIDAAIEVGRNKLPKETIEKLAAYRFRWIGL